MYDLLGTKTGNFLGFVWFFILLYAFDVAKSLRPLIVDNEFGSSPFFFVWFKTCHDKLFIILTQTYVIMVIEESRCGMVENFVIKDALNFFFPGQMPVGNFVGYDS